MTPKEALEQLKEACKAEGYDYRGTMGEDLKLNELVPAFTDLVTRFGSIPTSITIEELKEKLAKLCGYCPCEVVELHRPDGNLIRVGIVEECKFSPYLHIVKKKNETKYHIEDNFVGIDEFALMKINETEIVIKKENNQ